MIRHLHPTDSARLLPFMQAAGRGEAFTLKLALTGQQKPFSAVRFAGFALSPRAWESCWIQTRRSLVQAIMRAGPRSGPLAWELRELYVHRAYVSQCWDVLEQLAVPAGRAGARRLFIRVVEGSPVFEQARRAGFVPVLTETLYRSASAADSADILMLGGAGADVPLRPRTGNDNTALFRLYCASTPVEARMGRGQTSEEWADGAERPGNWRHEMVLDAGDGHTPALVQHSDTAAGRQFAVAWANEAVLDPRVLVAAALAGAPSGPAATLVPSYNAYLAATLEEAGFAPAQSYETLVKVLAVPVREPARAVAAVG